MPLRLTGARDRRAELARHHASASGYWCRCLGGVAFGVCPVSAPGPTKEVPGLGLFTGRHVQVLLAVGWALVADGERASCLLGLAGGLGAGCGAEV